MKAIVRPVVFFFFFFFKKRKKTSSGLGDTGRV